MSRSLIFFRVGVINFWKQPCKYFGLCFCFYYFVYFVLAFRTIALFCERPYYEKENLSIHKPSQNINRAIKTNKKKKQIHAPCSAERIKWLETRWETILQTKLTLYIQKKCIIKIKRFNFVKGIELERSQIVILLKGSRTFYLWKCTKNTGLKIFDS